MNFEPWQVGQRIKELRTKTGKTLRELAEVTKSLDPEKKGVQIAQLSRIENGSLCDLRELHLITRALGSSEKDFLEPKEASWFIVRWKNLLSVCADVLRGRMKVYRPSGAHKAMMETGVYMYTPLVRSPLLVKMDEQGGDPITKHMQAYLFCISRCSATDLVLDRHPGEEIIHVLEGEIEFHSKTFVGEEKCQLLCVGDTLHFSSDLPHGFRAAGTNLIAKALLIFTPHI